MTRRLARNVAYVCGGDFRPGPRDTCPDPVHDWPLPRGYVDADEVASARLSRRWTNARCERCGLYGWRPGRINPETDHHVPAQTEKESTDGTTVA